MTVTISRPREALQAAPHLSQAPAIAISDLSVSYGAGLALDQITFSAFEGEQIALVGPNGAGKSTLFKALVGLLPYQSGQIALAAGHTRIAYVPQRSQVDWRFPVTVADVVLMGRTGRIGLLRWPSARDRQHVREALDLVQMSHLATRRISDLSGGQQQRVFLARALAQEAKIFLLDEPLTGLDGPSQDDVFQVLHDLRSQAVTVITALHDLRVAAQRFDRILLLNRRVIACGLASQVLTATNLALAYGGHLHLAMTADGALTVADTCCDEHHA